MERMVGTVSRGVRAPIIRQGDDLAQIVVDSVLQASQGEGFAIQDRDVIAVTEAVVARAQGELCHGGRHCQGRARQAGRRAR